MTLKNYMRDLMNVLTSRETLTMEGLTMLLLTLLMLVVVTVLVLIVLNLCGVVEFESSLNTDTFITLQSGLGTITRCL